MLKKKTPPLLLPVHLGLRVSNVKVGNVLGVDALHADGERFRRVEGERNEPSARVGLLVLDAGVDPELEQSRVACKESNRELGASLWPFQHRHELVVVAVQTEIEKR